MGAYRFHTGQTVAVMPSRGQATPRGSFKIVRLLPEDRGIRHYRIKSVIDGHERVVTEGEIG
jgi:hypothetical protein